MRTLRELKMALDHIKILALIIILLATLAAGLPVYWSKLTSKVTKYLAQCDAFARGIFLGAGLTHLLPEAINHYSIVHGHHESGIFITTICAFSFATLMWIEKCLPHHMTKFDEKYIIPFFLVFALGVHSIIEGYALGLEHTIPGCILLFTAIISHKSLASIALSIKLCAISHFENKKSLILFLIFSIMTPIGIIFGIISNGFFIEKESIALEAIADAIAAGTFIYIATMHESHVENKSKHISILFFILGIALMGYMGHAFLHSHSH